MSSIARAFTMRRKKSDPPKNDSIPSLPSRAASMRFSEKPIDIRKISSPVQLLSTTNMLTYNAPDVSVIQAQRKASTSVSSGSSARTSTDESDASSISNRSRTTDVSSIGSNSPTSSPQSDKKSSYFDNTPAGQGSSTLRRSVSTFEIRDSQKSELLEALASSETPAIPQRAPSHSKKAHEILARKRSVHGMSRTNSMSSISSKDREVRRTSMDFFNGKANDSTSTPVQAPHPFGKELEQLEEVAEEFNGAINDVERANDLRAMKQRGLVKFCADDYLSEIEPLFGGLFGHSNRLTVPAMAWI